jgi:hypothetical protein
VCSSLCWTWMIKSQFMYLILGTFMNWEACPHQLARSCLPLFYRSLYFDILETSCTWCLFLRAFIWSSFSWDYEPCLEP